MNTQRNGWRSEVGGGRGKPAIVETVVLIILLFIVVFGLPGCARAAALDDQICVLAAFAAVDYRQSVDAFYHQTGYQEMNPLLGKHPSRSELALFGIIGIGLTWVASQMFSPAWSAVVVDSIVASEQWNIEDNALLMSEGRRRIDGIPIIVSLRF